MPEHLPSPIALERVRALLAECPPEGGAARFLERMAAEPGRTVHEDHTLKMLSALLEAPPGARAIVGAFVPVYGFVGTASLPAARVLTARMAAMAARFPHPYTEELVGRLRAALRIREIDAEGRLPERAANRLHLLLNPFRPSGAPPRALEPVATPGLLALRDWLEAEEPGLWSALKADFEADAAAFEGPRP